LVPEVPCDRAIPPPDIHKIRRQVTQSFSKSPRFSAMNHFFARRICPVHVRCAHERRAGARRLRMDCMEARGCGKRGGGEGGRDERGAIAALRKLA
ncbi:hypothetical protein, partial [Burkholderia mallei]